MVKRVGFDYKPGTKLLYTYFSVNYDDDGWADAKEWLPYDYDICWLRDADGNQKVGWRSGPVWDGQRISQKERYYFWKRKMDYNGGV